MPLSRSVASAFGGAPIGGLYGRDVSSADGVAAIHRALDLGLRALGWVDTLLPLIVFTGVRG
jgi:hypothetical protein